MSLDPASVGALVLGALFWRRGGGSAPSVPDADHIRAALRSEYPAAPPPASASPLRSPAGLVAVGPAGLDLDVGPEPGASFRRVPWPSVRHVLPARGAGVVVYVARVGPVEVPAELAAPIRGYRDAAA